MKRIISVILCITLVLSCAVAFTSCKNNDDNEQINIADIKTASSPEITKENDIKESLKHSEALGVAIDTLAFIGSGKSNSKKQYFLCKMSFTNLFDNAFYAVLYVYNNGSSLEIKNVIGSQADTFDSKGLMGGWEQTKSPAVTEKAQNALQNAKKNGKYTPVALLATQIVSGTNYCLLCKVSPTGGAEPYFALVYVYESLDGTSKIIDEKDFSLSVEQLEKKIKDYDSLEDAQKAVGFKFNLPENLNPSDCCIIHSKVLQVLVDNGYARKAPGNKDISGDSFYYSQVNEKEQGNKKITIKGDGKNVSLATWTDGDYSYCLRFDDGISEAQMLKYINEIK